MPPITQKAAILVRAGVVIVGHPAVDVSEEAVAAWNPRVDALFAADVMSRAARSLREAEEAQRRSQMRHVSARLGREDPRPPPPGRRTEGQSDASMPLGRRRLPPAARSSQVNAGFSKSMPVPLHWIQGPGGCSRPSQAASAARASAACS